MKDKLKLKKSFKKCLNQKGIQKVMDLNLWSKSLKYYKRQDVQEAIVREAEHREVGTRMIDGRFGKRPDILTQPSEIFEFARKKAISFHFSEELWKDPLEIKEKKSLKELNELRIGWDLVLDVDGLDFEISRIATKWFQKVLEYYEVEYSIKFSGNKGFHLGIPFEHLPEEINVKGQLMPIKTLYPETPRRVAKYIEEKVRFRIKQDVENKFSKEELEKLSGKQNPEVEDLINIDTILISSRHLFRAPYSLHEKSGLVSIPIAKNHVMSFSKEEAEPDHVETERWFIKRGRRNASATKLIISAFDYQYEDEKQEAKPRIYKKINLPKDKEKELTPPCIVNINKGLNEGRKRALFILINYYHSLNYPKDEIKERISEWNKKNDEELREAYVNSQINYFLSRPSMLPPNCDKDGFYKDIGVCEPNAVCKKIKNPVGYTRLMANIINENKPKKRRKKKNDD